MLLLLLMAMRCLIYIEHVGKFHRPKYCLVLRSDANLLPTYLKIKTNNFDLVNVLAILPPYILLNGWGFVGSWRDVDVYGIMLR